MACASAKLVQVGVAGFEPTTSSPEANCSTDIELHPGGEMDTTPLTVETYPFRRQAAE